MLPLRALRQSSRVTAVAGFALLALLGTAGGVAIASAGSGHGIDVTRTGCARGWVPPKSGTDTFEVTNRTKYTVDVQLQGTENERVYGEIFTLDAGTAMPMVATLEPGLYTWQCASVTQSIWTSRSGRVTGPTVANPTPSYMPVGPDDLDAAVGTYRNSVTAGLVTLVADTNRLGTLVDSGQMAQAKKQWLVAHLDYARLGAAYDTFGPFADEIDGRTSGLPGGVDNPNFTGFLKVEFELWHGQPEAAVKASVTQLGSFVHGLQAAFPHQLMINTDLPLRTHEILENALQFELTGQTDEGSNTNLATVSANFQGDEMTLNAIEPLLVTRDPQLLQSLQAGLSGLQAIVMHYRLPDGWWVPVQNLSTSQREQLDAAMDNVLEQSSLVPDQLRLFSVGAD
jgi:high-affinity iron transporter